MGTVVSGFTRYILDDQTLAWLDDIMDSWQMLFAKKPTVEQVLKFHPGYDEFKKEKIGEK